MASITLRELHIYHAIDREIFSRLLIPLKRQVAQSLLIMALFLWLEQAHSCYIISKLSTISDNLLDVIAEEAGLCLNLLKSKIATTHGASLIQMANVMGKEFSLETISQARYTTISGIKIFLNDVCAWLFTDILIRVLSTPSSFDPNTPIQIPDFPHTTFGPFKITILSLSDKIPAQGNLGWKLNFEAPIDDRTLFLTFSRGFHVTEEEAKRFFINRCGDCIESFEMEQVPVGRIQPLYATMVLRSVNYMDKIMTGRYFARFKTNGKHIWARKFEKHPEHR